MKHKHVLCGLISGLLLVAGTSHAALILSENFNDYTSPNPTVPQYQTGLPVTFGGNLPDFTKSGGNAIHAVDLSNGGGNYAPMLINDNVITLALPIAANTLGTIYSVGFDAGPATYGADSETTSAADGLVFNIVNASNNLVDTFTYMPGAWAGSETLTPVSFQYTGDGTGDVRIQVGALLGDNRFGGAIDNLTIEAVPEPGTALFGLALVGITAVRRRRAAAV